MMPASASPSPARGYRPGPHPSSAQSDAARDRYHPAAFAVSFTTQTLGAARHG